MIGVIFTEFVEMVERRFSLAVADTMIERARLTSGGAYTTVGMYDYQELRRLVSELSELTGASTYDLARNYGAELFGLLVRRYPHAVRGYESCFAFLAHLENEVHGQVRRLYPGAEVPHLVHELIAPGCMKVVYSSQRGLSGLAHGLIEGCARHYAEAIDIEVLSADSDGTYACFMLKKK